MTVVLDGDEWYVLDDGKPLAPFVVVDVPDVFDLLGRFVGLKLIVVDELEGKEGRQWFPYDSTSIGVSPSLYREILARFPERKPKDPTP